MTIFLGFCGWIRTKRPILQEKEAVIVDRLFLLYHPALYAPVAVKFRARSAFDSTPDSLCSLKTLIPAIY